ncbi:MAG: hypothetical protein DRQ49_19440 [Gammaproteobacteria bacterium]|nr:MAG: hypothetical protein DRQ49_19440 [Gammaproteobacteria bacterium]
MTLNKIPTAREMSSNLARLSNLLCQAELIQPYSKNYLDRVSGKLRKFGRSQSWQYTINVSAPIDFVAISTKKLGHIAPHVYINVAVKPPDTDDSSPFTKLNNTIEVIDLSNSDLQSRWHIDLANLKEDGIYQAGPLFHLQGGGHKPHADRKKELKVSIPRWASPPMELILTCEMIIANFYPEKWKIIKRQQGWLELIKVAQQLCYPQYCQQIQDCLSGKPQSVLEALWATPPLT